MKGEMIYMMRYFFNRGYYPNNGLNDGIYNSSQFPWMNMLVGGIIALIVIALLIIGIIAFVRMMRHDRMSQMHHDSSAPKMDNPALRLLNERYARGEIGEEEYKTRKTNLLS
jgi:putative membrane protein